MAPLPKDQIPGKGILLFFELVRSVRDQPDQQRLFTALYIPSLLFDLHQEFLRISHSLRVSSFRFFVLVTQKERYFHKANFFRPTFPPQVSRFCLFTSQALFWIQRIGIRHRVNVELFPLPHLQVDTLSNSDLILEEKNLYYQGLAYSIFFQVQVKRIRFFEPKAARSVL